MKVWPIDPYREGFFLYTRNCFGACPRYGVRKVTTGIKVIWLHILYTQSQSCVRCIVALTVKSNTASLCVYTCTEATHSGCWELRLEAKVPRAVWSNAPRLIDGD